MLRFVKLVYCAAHESYILENLSGAELMQCLYARLGHLATEGEAYERDTLRVEWEADGKSTGKQLPRQFGTLLTLGEQLGELRDIGPEQQVLEQ